MIHANSGCHLLEEARWCDTCISRMRGFTFKRSLEPEEGLVLAYSSDSRIESAITMLFVNFDLGVIWVNDAGEVVDKTLARSWRISYAPQEPARFVVEASPKILNIVQLGDRIEFKDTTQEPQT